MSRQAPLISQLLFFLKDPKSQLSKIQITKTEKMIIVLKLTSIAMVLSFTIGALAGYMAFLAGYNQVDNNTIVEIITSIPGWMAVFLIVFFGPLTEELAFRFLLKPNKTIFLTGVFFYTNFAFTILTQYSNITNNEKDIFSVFLFIVTIILIIINFTISKQWLTENITKYFNFLVYFSAISFGLIHITNYQNIKQYWWLTPLLVVPQLIVGIILPYVRVKLGFIWCFLMHSLYNGILSIYILGLLIGPGRSRELILLDLDLFDLLLKVSPAEQVYIVFICLLSFIAYLTIITLFLLSIFEWLRWTTKPQN